MALCVVRLAAFPRKALEVCWGMYTGELGPELARMDALHKSAWVNLVSHMFRGMENPCFIPLLPLLPCSG